MLNMKVLFIVPLSLFVNAPINASPTANEFVPCKKKALAILEYCLNEDEKSCWSKSKAGYESCRTDVIRRHAPDKRRIELEKKLTEKLALRENEK